MSFANINGGGGGTTESLGNLVRLAICHICSEINNASPINSLPGSLPKFPSDIQLSCYFYIICKFDVISVNKLEFLCVSTIQLHIF